MLKNTSKSFKLKTITICSWFIIFIYSLCINATKASLFSLSNKSIISRPREILPMLSNKKTTSTISLQIPSKQTTIRIWVRKAAKLCKILKSLIFKIQEVLICMLLSKKYGRATGLLSSQRLIKKTAVFFEQMIFWMNDWLNFYFCSLRKHCLFSCHYSYLKVIYFLTDDE